MKPKDLARKLKNRIPVEKEKKDNIAASDLQKELQQLTDVFKGFDKDHVWAFTAGNSGQDFRGNPKYLFVYINKYRKDIKAYWLCEDPETIQQVRDLGFDAFDITDIRTQPVLNRTGVLVAEQVKTEIPEGMSNVKYVNLWHGIGAKHIERALFDGDIAIGLAKKYVKNSSFYRDHQLLVATSPVYEKELGEDLGVDEDKIIRTGYLRCLYQQNYEPIATYEHDIRKIKGVSADTKLAVYAPTYRAQLGGTFSRALPDFNALHEQCEKNKLLMIFKIHSNMENEIGYLNAKKTYGDLPYFYFWDNRNDFYEIMDQIDLAIYDYSSIFSDMIAVGIRHYIRYVYDIDEYLSSDMMQGKKQYLDRTAGTICSTFQEMLDELSCYEEHEETEKLEALNKLLWEYSGGKDDFDKTIEKTLSFEISEREFPTLYSFDIFDTLFTRKVLDPAGVFHYVKERMAEQGEFPPSLVLTYPETRHFAEFSVREYYKKTRQRRHSETLEISFDEIFERLQTVYGLDDEQISLLKEWELECELDNVIPLRPQIEKVRQLVDAGETVVLISDMYLPKSFVQELLKKADPILAELPLFLSSDYGVQKTTQELFFEVYKSFSPFYNFKKWIHYGDNEKADVKKPRDFNISTRQIVRPEFNRLQQSLVRTLSTYDGYLVAADQARMCSEKLYEGDEFVISFVSLSMVPYIDWVIRDAQKRGYGTLIFISRDGHHLKRIADAMIKARGLDLKTKYIYGSRRAWRVPSFIHEVDESFWHTYGLFAGLENSPGLLHALNLSEDEFHDIFPEINLDTIDFLNKDDLLALSYIFRNSERYNRVLLRKAERERELVCGYLSQELKDEENYVFVEYWGRGTAQDCLTRLWRHITGNPEAEVPFYYSRSIYQTENGSIRYNFTVNDSPQLFVESLFANMPYKSIEQYEWKNGRIEPVFEACDYDEELFETMQRVLPMVAERYAALELDHPVDTDRMLYDFMFEYYTDNQSNADFAETFGSLVDAVTAYGRKREFAPPFTKEDLDNIQEKKVKRDNIRITSSVVMSATRTSGEERSRYMDMYQLLPGDDLEGGNLLSEQRIKDNNNSREKYRETIEKANLCRDYYYAACKKMEVSKRVLFVVSGNKNARAAVTALHEQLTDAQPNYEVLKIEVKDATKTDEETLKQLAEAAASSRLIIMNSPVALFRKITFREGTETLLVPTDPISVYKRGTKKANALKWKKKYSDLTNDNDISAIQVPSGESAEEMIRSFCRGGNPTLLKGSCSTDIYYNKQAAAAARKKLEKLFPEARNKRTILYIPDLRSRERNDEWADLIDLELLQEAIGNEYVVVYNYKYASSGSKYKNIINVEGFSKGINKEMTPRELLLACDVILGDYRSEFFESVFLDKPVFCFAFNEEKVMKAANFAEKDFLEYRFCPVVHSSAELAAALDLLDEYDYEPLHQFREKYYEYCDGASSERLISYIEDMLQ